MNYILIALTFPLTLFAFTKGNEKILRFEEAKENLSIIHKDHLKTLYCGCSYTGKIIDLKSCGYKVHKNLKRALRLEWEHVVPAEAFGKAFVEWREGDPKCVYKKVKYKERRCAKKNPIYAKMEADMYNLFPEVGELNGLRSNYSVAEIGMKNLTKKGITFGDCKAIIQDRKFEPMDASKGTVARTYMYMDLTYPGRGIISDKNRPLYLAWDKLYPVQKWECDRAKKIQLLQGNINPILEKQCGK